MRWRTGILVAGALSLGLPAQAHACYLYLHSVFLPIPASPTFGAGVQVNPDDEIGWVGSVDAAFKLGSKAVLRPSVGMCKSGDFSELIYGAAAALRIWADASGNTTVNVQTGFSYVSYDGGNDLTIPVGLAASFKRSNTMSLYAGGSLFLNKYNYETISGDVSDSDPDPVVFAGLSSNLGSMQVTAGAAVAFASETDIMLNLGFTNWQPTSAIRSLVSVFRR
jgi:hypothetical protein